MYAQKQKTLKDLTLKELGIYATNILTCGCPLIVPIDYTPDPINELSKLSKADCDEIVRYANHLAEKEGLGEKYFDPERTKKNLPVFTDQKPSDLEKKVTVGSAAAA
jgi:hypothetical protein